MTRPMCVVPLTLVVSVLLAAFHVNALQLVKEVSVPEGRNVKLICDSTNITTNIVDPSVGPAIFKWTKNNGPIIGVQKELMLKKVSPKDAGSYECEGFLLSNSGERMSQGKTKVILLVTNLRRAQQITDMSIEITQSPRKPVIGQRQELTVNTNPPQADLTIEWIRDGRVVFTGRTMVLDPLQESDLAMPFLINIRAPNGVMRSTKIGFLRDSSSKYDMTLEGNAVVVMLGEKKELHCEIDPSSGQRGSDVVWFFQDRQLSFQGQRNAQYGYTRDDSYYVSVLIIPSFSEATQGWYKCQAGGITKKILLGIAYIEQSIELNPPVLMGRGGQVLEFHCRLNNMNDVRNTDIDWYFLGENPTGNQMPLGVEFARRDPGNQASSYITKQQASSQDNGFYKCIVRSRPEFSAIGQVIIAATQTQQVMVTVSPRMQEAQVGSRVSIDCVVLQSNAPYMGRIQWRFANNMQDVSVDPRFSAYPRSAGTSQLTINGVQFSDNNLQLECYASTGRDVATLRVIQQPQPPPPQCDPVRNFMCADRQCLPRSAVCNGVPECRGGEDERNCNQPACDPLEKRCEYYNGQMPLKQVYSVNWQCDGEDDCGNGYDEQSCQNMGSNCGGTQYRCSDGAMIPRAFMCDGERDCRNGDDETGCYGAPNIQASSQMSQTVVRGSSVTFTCQASGKPMPRIVWRFNWRCLPDQSRMTTTYTVDPSCANAVSRLTISGVQPGDDGIYNCEAISGTKRQLSQPYQLILQY